MSQNWPYDLNLTHNVPVFDVEAEVDVEVLVVVVVEDAVGLPRLPEVSLEGDAGVVDDPVVVGVQQNHGERNWNKFEKEFVRTALLRPSIRYVNSIQSHFERGSERRKSEHRKIRT